MKVGKVILAGIAAMVFNAVFSMVTCGWLFGWIYKLEPTNIWKLMDGPPGANFYIGSLGLNILFALVYAFVYRALPGKGVIKKGAIFGLCVWAVSSLPGSFMMYSFMTMAPGAAVYFAFRGLVEDPIMGMIVAAIYKEDK